MPPEARRFASVYVQEFICDILLIYYKGRTERMKYQEWQIVNDRPSFVRSALESVSLKRRHILACVHVASWLQLCVRRLGLHCTSLKAAKLIPVLQAMQPCALPDWTCCRLTGIILAAIRVCVGESEKFMQSKFIRMTIAYA